MDDQEILRQRTNSYLEEQGVKAIYICQNCDPKIDTTFFSRWRRGTRKLNETCYKALDKFLTSKGY